MTAISELDRTRLNGQVLPHPLLRTQQGTQHRTIQVKIQGDGSWIDFHSDLNDGPGFAVSLKTDGAWINVTTTCQNLAEPETQAKSSRSA